jgi:hypothetical protein
MKAQTSIVMIVIILFLFIGLGAFLFLTGIKNYVPNEYNNLYAHNLLLSVMRKDSGYSAPCRTVSEILVCAHSTPEKRCGGMRCKDLSDQVVPNLIGNTIKPNFDYLLIVEPDLWEIYGGYRLIYGNPNLERSRQLWQANEKVLAYDTNLNIKMIIVQK